jgi:hypothetical protein
MRPGFHRDTTRTQNSSGNELGRRKEVFVEHERTGLNDNRVRAQRQVDDGDREACAEQGFGRPGREILLERNATLRNWRRGIHKMARPMGRLQTQPAKTVRFSASGVPFSNQSRSNPSLGSRISEHNRSGDKTILTEAGTPSAMCRSIAQECFSLFHPWCFPLRRDRMQRLPAATLWSDQGLDWDTGFARDDVADGRQGQGLL